VIRYRRQSPSTPNRSTAATPGDDRSAASTSRSDAAAATVTRAWPSGFATAGSTSTVASGRLSNRPASANPSAGSSNRAVLASVAADGVRGVGALI
jgi:hypothetical protein